MSHRYRILIVEDEEIECQALEMMLKYNRQDIQEIDTASNGVQALELYQTFRPDIVLMDINLPGINGLDVIRQIRQLPGRAGVVIVSAHSQFTYAQEALRLGVQDFLVKPIRLEDINRVLDDLIRQLERSYSQEETAQNQRERIAAIRPVLERDCVLSIASMQSNTPLGSLFDFMQIPITCGFVIVIHGEGAGVSAIREVKTRMGDIGLHCIGAMINEYCICVALSDHRISQNQICEMVSLLKTQMQFAEKGYTVGVGGPADCADDLRMSYEQAMTETRNEMMCGQSMTGPEAKRMPSGNSLSLITSETVKVIHCIRSGDPDSVANQVKAFFGLFQMTSNYHQIQEAAYWLYIMVLGNFSFHGTEMKPLTSARIFATQDMVALCNTLTEAFTSLIDLQDEEGNQQSNQIIQKARQIVKTRYQENLTLDDVAEELNISLFYLSKLFRKHTGISFTEYLTQVRMDHARSLLNDSSWSVKEVAYATGFNSQSYFSKIFKKYTGKSPSEYRGE